MFKDNLEEDTFINLINFKKIDSNLIDKEVEWCSDSIKIAEKTKGVLKYYNDENQFFKMVAIKNNTNVITDKMEII